MSTATLERRASSEFGTFGTLTIGSFSCCTLERQWFNNQQEVSCIPVGTYQVVWNKHPIHGNCYQIMNVPNRSDILIHSANVFQQLKGCIALGLEEAMFPIGSFNGIDISEEGIQHSKQALTNFEAHMLLSPFTLEITNE